jgi:hypothetical protein
VEHELDGVLCSAMSSDKTEGRAGGPQEGDTVHVRGALDRRHRQGRAAESLTEGTRYTVKAAMNHVRQHARYAISEGRTHALIVRHGDLMQVEFGASDDSADRLAQWRKVFGDKPAGPASPLTEVTIAMTISALVREGSGGRCTTMGGSGSSKRMTRRRSRQSSATVLRRSRIVAFTHPSRPSSTRDVASSECSGHG